MRVGFWLYSRGETAIKLELVLDSKSEPAGFRGLGRLARMDCVSFVEIDIVGLSNEANVNQNGEDDSILEDQGPAWL